MVLVGVLLGPQVGNVISSGVLDVADGLRTIAVMVILMKTSLGLDREKRAQSLLTYPPIYSLTSQWQDWQMKRLGLSMTVL
uniref:hypothetical protein n=1 Tax=Petrachloros mirabilis TaxID=2918835 RepID=UPI001EE82F38|nr:hypothetical protein [Petrachloros mirabilis]